MKLELASFQVDNVALAPETHLSNKTLFVSEGELKDHLLPDPFIQDIRIDVARPGESARIVNAIDVVEPRAKASGAETVFPGRLGPPMQVGSGTTNRLAEMAVVGTAEPFVGEEYWYAREAIIDMSAAGAAYSPFSETVNLVLHFIPRPGGEELDPARRKQFVVDTRTREAENRMKATRNLTLKAARFLAEKVKGMIPDYTRTYELGPVDPSLPGVVYLCKSLSAGIYGSFSTTRKWVVPMHPNEMMDGAVVNFGFLIAANFRDCTYAYQRNAVVEELYSRHGVDLQFSGRPLLLGVPLHAGRKGTGGWKHGADCQNAGRRRRDHRAPQRRPPQRRDHDDLPAVRGGRNQYRHWCGRDDGKRG